MPFGAALCMKIQLDGCCEKRRFVRVVLLFSGRCVCGVCRCCLFFLCSSTNACSFLLFLVGRGAACVVGRDAGWAAASSWAVQGCSAFGTQVSEVVVVLRCVASAFVASTGCSKLHRASGECLGATCRGRTCQATICRREPQAGCDLRVSEWGNPAGVTTRHYCKVEGTRGTETSKYPQEKKTDVIPPVAASDRGEA